MQTGRRVSTMSLFVTAQVSLVALNTLYGNERPKSLTIKSAETGPKFTISVEGDRSGCISSMEIFAMDYALFKVTAERLGGPGFMTHGSHLFDGVDARQAAAIEIARRLAEHGGLFGFRFK